MILLPVLYRTRWLTNSGHWMAWTSLVNPMKMCLELRISCSASLVQTASKHTQWWWVGPASGCSQSFSHSVIQSISHRVIYYSHVWLRKNNTRTPPSDHPLWVNWLITVRWILIKSHVCLLYTSLFPSNQTQMSGRNVFSVQHQHELCVWFNLTLVTPRATWKIKVTRW